MIVERSSGNHIEIGHVTTPGPATVDLVGQYGRKSHPPPGCCHYEYSAGLAKTGNLGWGHPLGLKPIIGAVRPGLYSWQSTSGLFCIHTRSVYLGINLVCGFDALIKCTSCVEPRAISLCLVWWNIGPLHHSAHGHNG